MGAEKTDPEFHSAIWGMSANALLALKGVRLNCEEDKHEPSKTFSRRHAPTAHAFAVELAASMACKAARTGAHHSKVLKVARVNHRRGRRWHVAQPHANPNFVNRAV